MVSFVAKNPPGVHTVSVSEEASGQRLDNFLITYLKGVPKSRIYRIVRKGEVRVNKGRVKPSYRLMTGDIIRIPPIRVSEEENPITEIPKRQADSLLSSILYEDTGLLVINKPAGMAVHGGSGLSFGVIEALRILRPEAKVLELVHRLDRDTSGCLMIAKRKSTLRAIHEQLKAGQLEKVYWTLVSGRWTGPSFVNLALLKNQLSSGERIVRVNPEGQQSITEFKVLKQFANATLLEAKPLTGRTHQIRVHAQASGHPIAGDPKYGDPFFNKVMKDYGLSRLFLHARQLTLQLPETGQQLIVEAPLDSALTATLDHLVEENTHG
jgi:23S rRNA pseudouridine955/2504/2580 synthase